MTLWRKYVPHPWLTLFLFGIWQLLMNNLSPITIATGALLALGIPLLTKRFWPNPPRLRRPLILLRLGVRIIFDIVVANIQVARLILGPTENLRPAFVEYPLLLTDPLAVSVLASIISLTPGTVTADVSPDHQTLLIHALDVADEEILIRTIQTRYEKPLLEVF